MMVQITALAFGLCAASAFAQAPEAAPSPAATSSPAAPATSAAPAAPVASEAPRVYLESASIVVDGKAEYNGSIQLEFTPLGGTSKTLDVNVLAKTGRKDIAKDINKELLIAGGSLYKVKLSGDTIKISKGKGAQNFAIVIRKLNVSGVSVLVKKG